jgi:hypothetical protein
MLCAKRLSQFARDAKEHRPAPIDRILGFKHPTEQSTANQRELFYYYYQYFIGSFSIATAAVGKPFAASAGAPSSSAGKQVEIHRHFIDF